MKALGARGDYEVTAFSTFKTPGVRDGIQYRQFADWSKRGHADVVLAYYDTRPLMGVSGCLRIASHHTLQIPFPETYAWTDLNVAPSQYAVDALRKVFDDTAPWAVMPNGVGDMPRLAEQVPGRVIYHTSPSRGLHLLVEAWPEIKRRVPHATLHIIGDVRGWIGTYRGSRCRQGERASRLQAALAKAGDSVTLLGHLPRREVLRELAEAQCFAFPASVVAPCETFSVSIMECLKLGTPVVLAPCDALESIYEHAVRIRFLGRPFVDSVVDTLNLPRGWHIELGRQFAASFTFEAEAAALDAAIRQNMAADHDLTAAAQ